VDRADPLGYHCTLFRTAWISFSISSTESESTPTSEATARKFRTARRAFENAISCKSSIRDSGEVGIRIAIGRPSRVTTIVPAEATFCKTAPGLELNSLEAIICINSTFAQQIPEDIKNFRPVFFRLTRHHLRVTRYFFPIPHFEFCIKVWPPVTSHYFFSCPRLSTLVSRLASPLSP